MKKIIVAIVVAFMLSFSYRGISYAFSDSESKMIEEKYEELGKVGMYTLYKDGTVQFFAEALEKIYEDNENEYYLPDISSHIYTLKNGEETISLKEALATNKVTIDDVQKLIPRIIVTKK